MSTDARDRGSALCVYHAGEEVPGLLLYGLVVPGARREVDVAAPWSPGAVAESPYVLHGPGWEIDLWTIRLAETPSGPDWVKALSETLALVVAAGYAVTWTAVEGDFVDPPELFGDRTGHGCYAALSSSTGFLCNDEGTGALRMLEGDEIAGLRRVAEQAWSGDAVDKPRGQQLDEAYRVVGIELPSSSGSWSTLRVDVIRESDEQLVGSYERNYSSLFHTFAPFAWGDRTLALYSRDYTATRVMELPSCQDLGGEEQASGGFCPVDYFVASDPETGESCGFGLVAGCIWGDDTSWKIQYLDLREAHMGRIVRDERLGYLELPEGKRLKDVITVRRCHPYGDCAGYYIEIEALQRFEVRNGRPLRSYEV